MDIVLCGIGGYGRFYLKYLLDNQLQNARLCAAVDPTPQRCSQLDELSRNNIQVYDSLDNFYRNGSADLVIIASPHQFHASQTIAALTHKSNVLCEKPLCSTIQDALRVQMAQRESGLIVSVGFQRVFSDALQKLKCDILAGVLGKPLRFKTLVFWPRAQKYYQRNNWAGKMKDANGNWVLDSPIMNATAHFLHAMLHLLGKNVNTSAKLKDVQSELYRAYDIENCDTAALRMHTTDGVEILYYCSHVTTNLKGPLFEYAFEKCTVTSDGENAAIIARFNDGTTKLYGDVDHNEPNKIYSCIDAIQNRTEPLCGLESAIPHVLCVNAAHDSTTSVVSFPRELVGEEIRENDRFYCVKQLDKVLEDCYYNDALPSERSNSWARAGSIVNCTVYRWFPGGKEP